MKDTYAYLDRIVAIDAEIDAYCADKERDFDRLTEDLRDRLQVERRKLTSQNPPQLDAPNADDTDGKSAEQVAETERMEARFKANRAELLADFIDVITTES